MLHDPVQLLADGFRAGIARAFPQLGPDVDPLISPSKQTELGDFQSNAAMPLAKRLSMKPRDVAEKLIAAVDLGDTAEPLTAAAIAGPGFINIRLRPAALAALLQQLDSPDLGVDKPERAQTVVVDLMGV